VRFAILAGTMTALGGCMSSPGDQLASIQTLPSAHQQTTTALRKSDRLQQQVAADEQQSDIAAQALADANSLNAQTANANTLNAQAAAIEAAAEKKRQQLAALNPSDSSLANSLVARRNIAATQNSIYASADAATSDGADPQRVALNDTENGIEPTQAMNASQNSIYSGQPDEVGRDIAAIPMPDAKKVGEVQDLALAGKDVPPDVEVASADPAAGDIAALQESEAETDQGAKDRSLGDIPSYNQALSDVPKEPVAQPKKHRLTLADFFRKKKTTETASFDEDRFGKKRTLNTAAIPNMKTAALGDQALPGVNAMMPVHNMSRDEMSEDPDDDQPAGLMKLASLPGMMRVAPNGLWTQTDKVEIRCLRPALVDMLKQVEHHYGRPVVVTSGFRDPGHNRLVGGARHSLHTLCAAADIQVDGVSKWELADYLRSIPGRGGVGTYCHTESVHIDIGGERDWNWRCRRRRHG
jgi:uncharacterized protein YcbK (DUF882 family)